MENLISAHDLKKTYGVRPLFDGVTFVVQEGERVGLIGPNGAGKSSLLRIIAGQSSPDGGSLSRRRGLRVGFLEQTPTFESGATVLSQIVDLSGSDWEKQALAHELMSKLSLDDVPIDSLSGGWKKRVALARELAKSPDLLLLDEPTNHLDVESILWLEEFLSHSRFATITVTHDRLFLQRVATRILELDRRNPGGLLSVAGDYTTYLKTKEALMSAQEKQEITLSNTLRRETEWLRQGAKARTTKQQARIQRAGELEAEVQELRTRNQTRVAQLEFDEAQKNPKLLVQAKQISKSLGGKTLFRNLSLILSPGTRVGLLGPNGCGKSTLIRVLLGETPSDSGEIKRFDNLSVSYFEQNREALNPDLTAAKTLCPQGDHVEFRGGRVHIKSYLDRFLFTKEQMEMKVRHMSGGEQARLLIAQMMLNPANLLVLDEPTNDLDMATLNVLEDCLVDFNGAILFVTHDRYFLDRVATKILAFTPNGELLSFSGIEQWEVWQKNQQSSGSKTTPKTKPVVQTSSPKRAKLSFNEQYELDHMEENIQKLENELTRLTADVASPEITSDPKRLLEITKALSHTQAQIEHLYARWEELEKMR